MLLDYDSFWFHLTAHFVVSVSASIVFLLVVLRTLQPRLRFSKNITIKNKNNKKYYVFKIVNRSIYDCFSVSFELYRRIPYIVDGVKVNHDVYPVKLSRENIYSIPRRRKKIGYGDHAVLIATEEDLSKDIDIENLDYSLHVIAKHGLSNLTKVFVVSFNSSAVFHDGNFKFGSNTEVC